MAGRRFAHLADAWMRDARAAGAMGDVAGTGVTVLASWSEPHRAYHDLRHLDEVLRYVDDLADYARDANAVRLAAWFHDVVYDPARADNEERSAARAEEELTRLGVPAATVAEAGRLVRLTATHDATAGDADGEVLCDADLAVLAAEPTRYEQYAADVRREYAYVPDPTFAAGRSEVLRRLLALPTLYRTPTGRRWEARARANVAAELAGLTAGGPHS